MRWMFWRRPMAPDASVPSTLPPHVHQCCAWCTDEVHAECVFVHRSFTTREQFLAVVVGRPAGLDIVEARPAPEADREAMIRYHRQFQVEVEDAATGELQVSGPPYAWEWGEPWLIYYRGIKECLDVLP